jgi:hypothetical protein
MVRAVVAVLLLVAVAGCGGDDDDASTEQFAADANRICREGEARLNEVVDEARAAGDPQEAAAAVLERGTEAYAPYMERLRELQPPEDLRDDWTAFLDGVQEAFDLFPQLADATRSGDREQLEQLAGRFEGIARDTRPFAEEHGLRDCLPDEP